MDKRITIHTDSKITLDKLQNSNTHTYIIEEIRRKTMEERLKMKINLTQNFTAIVTGHGKTRAYLHQFKIIEEPTCPCGTAKQTTDHLIFECEMITKERERLKTTALQNGSWPTN